MKFTVYPAIDVRDGRVVRLRQGDYAQETRYAFDPLALSCQYSDLGADWLHLVDLDAARAGGYTLHALLREIVAGTALSVQSGGGVRSHEDVQALLDAGASRVVVGSVAVREPDAVIGWLRRFGPERITVALDSRRDRAGTWRLPLHGWTEASGRTLDQLLEAFTGSGLKHVLCTDIDRDGMLAGPNIELYSYLRQRAPWLRLQASGGVRDLDDVIAAKAIGCDGVVLGKALLEARLDLSQALSC